MVAVAQNAPLAIDREPQRRKQIVILGTDEGTARDEKQLEEIWNSRLEECKATHYKVLKCYVVGIPDRICINVV